MESDRGWKKPRNIARFAGKMTNPNDECRTLRIVEGKEVEQFLPGLPNDVALNQVVPKLPWRAFHTLSAVSPYWRKAILSRQVYNARVRAKSTETLVVLNHNHPDDFSIHALSLYSMRDDSWQQLPKFPFSKRGIPLSCQCVALDGKLYVLGGQVPGIEDGDDVDVYDDEFDSEDSDDSQEAPCEPQDGSELYVLDLVGQRGWKKCANMPEPRCDFACSALDGKVYVFGGFVDGGYSEECLVYDPKDDKWSSIASMTAHRARHHAVAVGDEFWIHGGEFGPGPEVAFPEVYHPGRDEWQYIEPERCHESERFFTVNGKLHMMTPLGIYVRQPETRPWRRVHLISLPDGCEGTDEEVEVVATQAIDDELLALICCSDARETQGGLVRSEGFGSEKPEIEFKVAAGNIFIEHQWYPYLMCPIQL